MLNEIKRIVQETRELPFMIEKVENCRNELNNQLNEISNKGKSKDLYNNIHDNFMKALNEAERLKCSLQGNISILNLCAAMISSGKIEELKEVMGSHSNEMQPDGQGEKGIEKPNSNQRETDNGLPMESFKVLEVKQGREGVTRAWCQMTDGNKIAVFSKGETAEVFLNAKGQDVTARYRPVEKGLFAVNAKVA